MFTIVLEFSTKRDCENANVKIFIEQLTLLQLIKNAQFYLPKIQCLIF